MPRLTGGTAASTAGSFTLTAVLLVSLGCSRSAEKTQVEAAKKSEPPQVRTAVAEQRMVDRAIAVTGALHPDDTVPISTEIQGRVARIYFDYGQSVRKGDVIAELEKTEWQIALDKSKASLAQALARIGLNPNQDDTIPTTTPSIRQAQAEYEDAKSKYESARKLVESGDIARERFVALEAAFQSRKAALDAVQDDLRMQLANLQALRADKRLIEKRLNDTVLRAPFDGQISQRMVAPGQFIKDNTPIVTLVKTWPLRLRLDVPEVATTAVRIGGLLQFSTEAIPGKTYTATITQLNPALDSRSRSLNAEARLNQNSPELKPGMFVQVSLNVAKGAAIVVVPKEAVYTVAGLTKLFAIRDNRAREIRFAPGETVEGRVEVTGGLLQAGERVAVEGINNLTDGLEVRAN